MIWFHWESQFAQKVTEEVEAEIHSVALLVPVVFAIHSVAGHVTPIPHPWTDRIRIETATSAGDGTDRSERLRRENRSDAE